MLLAEELWKKRDECSKRSGISRAYYAAYHECKEWHAKLPTPGSAADSKGGSHNLLIHQLANPMGTTRQNANLASKSIEISARLQSLRDVRHFADYDISEDLDCDEHFGLMIEVKTLLRDLGVQFPVKEKVI
ncbi:hypothetical protein N5C67_09565 [Comamonas thiooxydans]|uniref:hypothetical protein n=1 Tax=Comamonas thiooxydans TaxID=363952 RepID=UPI00244B0B9F|nr:hypothetical protein [Comamonas thiooxydans]MDH1252897.1 hypothetical protein [Comamonas thiooxydans]